MSLQKYVCMYVPVYHTINLNIQTYTPMYVGVFVCKYLYVSKHYTRTEECRLLSICEQRNADSCPYANRGMQTLVHMRTEECRLLSICEQRNADSCPHANRGMQTLVHTECMLFLSICMYATVYISVNSDSRQVACIYFSVDTYTLLT